MDLTEGEMVRPIAEDMLIGQTIPVRRIGLSEMRASPIQWDSFSARHDIVLEPRKVLVDRISARHLTLFAPG